MFIINTKNVTAARLNDNDKYCAQCPSACPALFFCRHSTRCTGIVQLLLQQVDALTNVLASRLSVTTLQQFIRNKGPTA